VILPLADIVAGSCTLRATDERDIDDIALACSDELLQRCLPLLPSPYTRADAEQWVREGAPARWADGGASFTIDEGGRLAGHIGLRPHPQRDIVEVGYWVAPWARGRGIATAATRAAVTFAFDQGAARAELLTLRANAWSQRVALAAGFRYEAVCRGAAVVRDGRRADLLLWARLATDPDGPAPRPFPDLPAGELRDGVVRLRPRDPDDAVVLTETSADPESQRWSTRAAPFTIELQHVAIERAESEWLTGERIALTICDEASGQPAGDVSVFWVDPVMGVVNLGYSVHPRWRRRGFATRAAFLASDWLLGLPSVARVEAGANVANTASQEVLRRAGFEHEGTLRSLVTSAEGPRQDIVLFSRVR
jgi:RimJ/RimL family protein N-acetyltransferase